MSLNIGRALQEGIARTLSRAGLLLAVVWFVLGLLNQLAYNSAIAGVLPDVPNQPMATLGPTLPLSPTAAGAVVFVLYLGSFVVVAAALRTFVTEETDTIPTEHFTRNLVLMLVNLIVGGIVYGIAVAIGLVLLIIPGIFIAVSLFFWNVYVIVEDQNFVESFQNSWALTSGNRLMLFVLGVVVVIVVAVVGGIFGVATAVLPGIVGLAFAQIGSAFTSVFAVATAARTYLQLTGAEAAAA